MILYDAFPKLKLDGVIFYKDNDGLLEYDLPYELNTIDVLRLDSFVPFDLSSGKFYSFTPDEVKLKLGCMNAFSPGIKSAVVQKVTNLISFGE